MKISKLILAAAVAGLAGLGTAQDTAEDHSGHAHTLQQQQPAAEAPATAPDTSETIATVNGAKITRAEVDEELQIFRDRLAKAGLPAQQAAQFLNTMEKNVVDALITRKLLSHYGDQHKVTLTDAEFKAELAKLLEQHGGEEELKAQLEEAGVSEEYFMKMMRKEMLFNKIVRVKQRELEPLSEEKIQAFYKQHLDSFSTPETVRASHILIGVEKNADEATKAEAKKEAEAILAKVKAGEDFAALARAHSDCPSSQEGGDLGTFGRGMMVKPFEDVAFALKPGEKSDIVETEFGYHIIQVTEHQDAKTRPLEELRDDIVDELYKPEINAWIDELRANADIRRFDEKVTVPPTNPTVVQ